VETITRRMIGEIRVSLRTTLQYINFNYGILDVFRFRFICKGYTQF